MVQVLIQLVFLSYVVGQVSLCVSPLRVGSHISYSSMVFLDIIPGDFQSQASWGLLCPDQNLGLGT